MAGVERTPVGITPSWRRRFFLLLGAALASASDEVYAPFSKISKGCVPGEGNGSNCAKYWEFSGGDGYSGQRPLQETNIYCSPSCTDASNPKICSLIMVLHGLYMDVASMEWLMLRGGGGNPYGETPADGGPFCISFHKSYADGWTSNCNDDNPDQQHLHGFILWALSAFPINPDAVNLHGYSSGGFMINSIMFTGCRIEPLIAAVAPYAGGGNASPTTKAAYLVPHGTHDNIVQYTENWTGSGKAVPSCECDGLFEGYSCFNDNNSISLYGPTLAASIAMQRGYKGGLFTDYPPVAETFHFIDGSKCDAKRNKCVSPLASPNPWNDNFDCDALPAEETDSIEFSVGADAGPVVLWRMNLHNHDYPDVQRYGTYGPVEFYFQLRKFFYANRRRYSRVVRTVTQESTGRICSDPNDFDDYNIPPRTFFQKTVSTVSNGSDPVTKDECKQMCQDDYRCTDAFYVDYRKYGYTFLCKIYFDLYPCKSTTARSSSDATHFKARESAPTGVPTAAPTGQPGVPTGTPIKQPKSEPTSAPTSSPSTREPSPSMCISPKSRVIPCRLAGYNCSNGGDSNDGTTKQICEDKGGTWSTYGCPAAYDFWLTQTPDYQDFFAGWWREKCCEAPFPEPPQGKMCHDPATELDGNALAGYSCLKDGSPISDSNDFNGLTEQACRLAGNVWYPYNCDGAQDYYNSVRSDPELRDLIGCWWVPKCCVAVTPTYKPVSAPTVPPVPAPTAPPVAEPPTFKNCDVTKCAVPACIWSGKDGPGWDPSWTADDDGKRTKNGFCTDYCKVYDVTTEKALCGTSPWHLTGTDCSGCSALADDPIIDERYQKPSSGLCKDATALSAHALWGSGMRECGKGTGPEPTTETRCTVYQAFNGDALVNPGRTCRSFCSSLHLLCSNGYDDQGDGCKFGGPGIGCDDILGVGSIGGPTPDHVCVCTAATTPTKSPVTTTPTKNPTAAPTKAKAPTTPTNNPTAAPTKAKAPTLPPTDRSYCTRDDPICWPTDKEINDLDLQLRGKVTGVPADGSSYDVCYAQGDDSFKLVAAGNGVCYQYHDCRYEFCRAEQNDPDLQLPGLIVQAANADDVSLVLQFAADHNMAVTVKTSGHSFMGSSTGKDTLNIVTTELDENDKTQLLAPYTWKNSCPDSSPVQHVLRAGGGTMWKQGYLAAGFGVNVVGGGALSVSVAGGWLQGCGLSAMTPTHGLGIDNVLAFDVVTADGSLVTADPCSHPDLFWALRGGGGGTFGVVTKIHYRAHTNPTTRFVNCRVAIKEVAGKQTIVDAWIDFVVEKSAAGIDRRWGGYWSLEGSVTFWFRGSMNDAKSTLINDLEAVKNSLPANLRAYFVITYERHSSYLASRGGYTPDNMYTDKTGNQDFYIGSWLIPKADIETASGQTKAKNMLKKISRTYGTMFNYLLGGVTNDIASDATAVHPVMRSSVWQLEVFRPIHMSLLMETFPNGCAGINHHSKDLPDWKNNLWGSNYPRLESIKATYDPNNLFNCHHCVGYIGREPFQQPGVVGEDIFRLLSSVRVTDSSGHNVIGMKIGMLEGPALGLDGPRFISDGPYDWKPMYSPGNGMVTFFRTFNANFEIDTVIKVLKAEENGQDVGTVSTSGRNYNPTWNRGDFDLPDADKRVLWVRYDNWEDKNKGDQLRPAAYTNCASCKGSEQRMLSSEAVMDAARTVKRNQVLKETNNEYYVYDVGEWPMTSLHDGRVLILRQFVAINYPANDKFKRWSELHLLTVPAKGSPTVLSDYEIVTIPPGWDIGWVHKIYFSAGENYVTYQRNGNEGEDHLQSSLCLANFQANAPGTGILASVTNENCFVQNNPQDQVMDWYARMTEDERHIVFSSNRKSSLIAHLGNLAYEPYRLYAYVMATGNIVQLTPTYSFKNYWYPSTYGLTTFFKATSSPTSSPQKTQSVLPSLVPSLGLSLEPSGGPSLSISHNPSSLPSETHSSLPSLVPSSLSLAPSGSPSVDLSTDSPTQNVCLGLPKNKCNKKADQCIFAKKKMVKQCVAKDGQFESDCSQTTSKPLCLAKDWCKYRNDSGCSHTCIDTKKNICKTIKVSKKKICKWAKKSNPCFKCHPVSKCT